MNETATTGMMAAGLFITGFVAVMALILIPLVGRWMVYLKAGKPGWACLVPIYNTIVLLQVAGKPLWWIFLYLLPVVNIVISIMTFVALVRKFGHGIGFVLGMIFLPFVFYPILGFGKSRYNPAA